MASSQVEIALSSPFGCVLRKYNCRERCRESNSLGSSQGSFQNDDRSFTRDHVDRIRNSVTPPNEKTNNNTNNDARNNKNNVGFTKEEKEESFSSSSCSKQSQILDRWAARKAREMVSTIETEAELLENLGSSSSSSSSPRPPSSCASSETSKCGASSLVQIWEMRLNNTNQSSKCNGTNPSTTISRPLSLGSSETGEFTDESSPYSDRVSSVTNEPTCSTPRVADIIKRLKENNYGKEQCTSNNNSNNNNMMMMMGSSSPSSSSSLSRLQVRDCGSIREQGEPHAMVLHQVTSSPRLRGRRAFTDLLMQMERDRHGELKNLAQLAPVSNFSQRGRSRIQSLLRLRLLKRHHEYTKTFEVNKQPQRSTIMLLRKRFNMEVKNGNTALTETASSRNTRLSQSQNPHTHNQTRGEQGSGLIGFDQVTDMANGCQTVIDNASSDDLGACAEKPMSQTNEEEAHVSSEAVCLEAQNVATREETNASNSKTETICLEAQNVVTKEVAETSTSNVVDLVANHETENEADLAEVKQYNSAEIEINYVAETINEEEEYASEGNDYDEEQHYDDENYYDWISSISRPRSYWEDRRQAWYREMLDTAASDKGEIRQLLERRTVSTFLSSDFRERMDKLMETHIGTQTHLISSQEDDEDNGGKMDQLIAFLQQHLRPAHNLEEEEQEEYGNQEEQEVEVEEEEEEESLTNGGYNESSDYCNQSSPSTHIPDSSSPNLSSWSYRDNEASDDSDRIESTASSTQPSRSQSFYLDSHQSSSSINPHSVEMDLIYDMRGQMEQLYREMAEIKKSIKSCIEMQMVLQKSMNRNVDTVREKKKKKKSHDDQKPQKKGNCCICYEKKVDSLLYRCGHMRTCIKCANELQWNSGKCPICRAPIADVVRVYVDALD